MRRSLAILVTFLLVFFLWPSEPSSPEEQIRKSIENVADATRRGNAGGFMDEISEAFSDPRFTRKSLHGMLLREFLNGGGTAVHLGPISIELGENQDRATAAVAATFPGAFLETTLKATELGFELEYALEEDGWRILAQTNSASDD